MIRRPPRPTRTPTLLPSTPLFRSTAPPVARMHELTMLRGRNSLRPEWYGAQQVPFSTGGLQECDCRQFARNLHSGWVACGAPRPMETERCTRILPEIGRASCRERVCQYV